MHATPIVPQRNQLFGDWYLVATADGFLNRFPRVETLAITASPHSGGRIRYQADVFTLRRHHRFRTVCEPPAPDGTFTWVANWGLTALTPQWKMTTTQDGSLLASHHRGSLLAREGWMFFARIDLAPEDARARLLSSFPQVGVPCREPDELSFREKPERRARG